MKNSGLNLSTIKSHLTSIILGITKRYQFLLEILVHFWVIVGQWITVVCITVMDNGRDNSYKNIRKKMYKK